MKTRTVFSNRFEVKTSLWHKFALIVLMLCVALPFPTAIQAQTSAEPSPQEQDTVGSKIVASLLTCAPGDETYEIYGHTALRIRDLKKDKDIVYNYGFFNFKRPNFVWHFILGETDYSVRAMSWEHFYELYTSEGRWIDEQVLNLTPEEANKLALSLDMNSLEAVLDDWTYRYNYLTDNCTTRAIDQIRNALSGMLILPDMEQKTYREELHIYTKGHAWSQLGNDMLLGAGCDAEIDAEGQLFLPIEAETILKSAKVKGDNGIQRPLVESTNRIATFPPKPADTYWAPLVWSFVLLAFTICLTIFGRIKRKTFWLYDFVLLLLQGIAGCLITFMVTCSEHATVDSNLLISWLNPLPLVFLWPTIRSLRQNKVARFFWLQTAMLIVFYILAALQTQQFPTETLVLALCLLIRAINNLTLHFKRPSSITKSE